MNLEKLPRTLELYSADESRVSLRFVDQTRLPSCLIQVETDDWRRVVEAIARLEIRGAPAIGLAGASALVLAFSSLMPEFSSSTSFMQQLRLIAKEISSTRPTAINLSWGVKQVLGKAETLFCEGEKIAQVQKKLFEAVKELEREDERVNRAIGAQGADLLPSSCRVLTHCNAGSLATGFYGTALGVIYAGAAQGKIERVFVDETRPVGQGARLTSWELSQVGIPATLICDNMAASVMASGRVDAIVVGADRICRNGDVANKVGTYGLAVLAHYHQVPFYVAAPLSSIDFDTEEGSRVLIEERSPDEISSYMLEGLDIYNPAFDITPSTLIAAVITEQGVFSTADKSWDDLVRFFA